MATCISKMDSCIWKNNPKSRPQRRDIVFMTSLSCEMTSSKMLIFSNSILNKSLVIHDRYTYKSVTHTTWCIPYIKAYTVEIALDKKHFVKMSRGGERERNKKIFKSLYSATTLINLFDYFIEHLWRHVWLRYDVNFYDS